MSNELRKDVSVDGDVDELENEKRVNRTVVVLRSEKPPRSVSKDKKVKFKEVFDTRNIQKTKQERQKKDQYLEEFRSRSRSNSPSQSNSFLQTQPQWLNMTDTQNVQGVAAFSADKSNSAGSSGLRNLHKQMVLNQNGRHVPPISI